MEMEAKIRLSVDNLVNSTEIQPSKNRRMIEIASKIAAVSGFLSKKRFENHNQNSTETHNQCLSIVCAARIILAIDPRNCINERTSALPTQRFQSFRVDVRQKSLSHGQVIAE
jgi:hypothetical protein